MTNISSRNILVIHGPNMNLLGLRQMGVRGRITLNKLNRHLRIISKKIGISLTIIQTNEEGRAVSHLQSQRKKIKGILLFPGPWKQSGYVIKDTLEILAIPCIIASLGKNTEILKGIKSVEEEDIHISIEKTLTWLSQQIQRAPKNLLGKASSS